MYLRRVIRNSSLYNPYDLEVHLLPPLGTLLAACPGACGVVFCHPEHARVALLPMARAAVSNHMYVIAAIHPYRWSPLHLMLPAHGSQSKCRWSPLARQTLRSCTP